MDKYSFIWFDDKLVSSTHANLHVASSAVLYGLSIYTVFQVSKTDEGLAAFRIENHFNRLCESAQIMGIDSFPGVWTLDKFKSVVSDLVQTNNVDEDVLVRATVHVSDKLPGTKSRGLKSVVSIFIYPAKSILPATGARLKTSMWRRVPDISIPARAKVNGAYVNSVLANQDALDSGYDDCIFLDSRGHVCELSTANIFLVKNGLLITPSSTSDLLEGITRKTIIEIAKELNLEVIQRTVDLTELYIADEVFASGTSVYISPVIEIDARKIADGKPGVITRKLMALHSDMLHGKNQNRNKFLTVL